MSERAESGIDAAALAERPVPARLEDIRHGGAGYRACEVPRRWPLGTLVAYLFDGRECDDVRALLARGVGVARGSRVTWPPFELTAAELSAVEGTFPPQRPDRPLVMEEVVELLLETVGSPDAGAAGPRAPTLVALRRDDEALRRAAERARYLRFDYGPWADLYEVALGEEEATALLAAASRAESDGDQLALAVVRRAEAEAEAGARLRFVVPRAESRAPWRELPPT